MRWIYCIIFLCSVYTKVRIMASLVLLCVLIVGSTAQDLCRAVEEGTLDRDSPIIVEGNVSRGREFEINIITDINDETETIVIRSELTKDEEGSGDNSPVYFTANQLGSMRNWQIPAHNFPQSRLAERTLCPLLGRQKVRLAVSTNSVRSRMFRMTVSRKNFLLRPGEDRHDVTVSPTTPQVFRFKFEEQNQKIHFKITNSSLASCAVVSFQKAEQCPYAFYDEESNIKYGSSYQTMLQKSAMVISKDMFNNSFYLILVGKSDNLGCYKKHKPTSDELEQHSMTVSLVVEDIEESILTGNIVFDSILAVTVFYVGMALLFVFITCIMDKCFGFELDGLYGEMATLGKMQRRQDRNYQVENALVRNPANLVLRNAGDEVDAGEVREIMPSDAPTPLRFRRPWWPCYNQAEWTKQFPPEEVDGPEEGVANSHSQTNFCTLDRTTTRLQDKHFHQSRSNHFSWLIVLVGIFYGLPAFQLVNNNQNTFLHGGDLDLCYYNFFCVYSLGGIADFGHFFSNIGYIVSGLYFMVRVLLRKRKFNKLFHSEHREDRSTCTKSQLETGVPEQTGIFYALGGALVLEGCLSGIYHICPTSTNFQFDTTFMFLIAVMLFLKMYQFRHSDTALTAQLVFLVIGIALTLEVIGYFTSHMGFWIAFILIYILFMLVFILKLYLNEKNFREVISFVKSNICICCTERKLDIQWRNMIPCMIVVLVNLILACFFAYSHRPGVSRYLLAILMINMMLYEIYYVGRKLHLRLRPTNWRENEGIRLITLIYFFMSVVFMMGALHFFRKELKTSAGTPAESRNLNDDCCLLIFDNHDMWHFLSAAGLYQHFMFVLTLEDYNIRYKKDRNLITVF